MFSRLLLLASLVSVLAATAAADVDHYPVAGRRSNSPGMYGSAERAAYPQGVTDPSLSNPPQPPPEVAVATPPTTGQPTGTTPLGSPVYAPTGHGVPAGAMPVAQPVYQPTIGPAILQERPVQSSWYGRIDYFHWNERIEGSDFVNEDGTLYTLGYVRRIGIERFRAELFGGDVHYEGYGQYDTGLETMVSNTRYLGVRGEYELVLEPPSWQGRLAFLLGVGSRVWVRDLHDGDSEPGNPVWGYQETWWTMYPYIGLETHRPVGAELDLYTESRVGLTALTYEHASIMDRPLWPKCGAFANIELGLRGPRFFIAGRGEVMTWGESSVVQDSYQPRSVMVTVGGRFGIVF